MRCSATTHHLHHRRIGTLAGAFLCDCGNIKVVVSYSPRPPGATFRVELDPAGDYPTDADE